MKGIYFAPLIDFVTANKMQFALAHEHLSAINLLQNMHILIVFLLHCHVNNFHFYVSFKPIAKPQHRPAVSKPLRIWKSVNFHGKLFRNKLGSFLSRCKTSNIKPVTHFCTSDNR